MYAGSKDGLEAQLSSAQHELAKLKSKSDESSSALDKSREQVTALHSKAQKCIAMVNTLKVRVHFEVVCCACVHAYVCACVHCVIVSCVVSSCSCLHLVLYLYFYVQSQVRECERLKTQTSKVSVMD